MAFLDRRTYFLIAKYWFEGKEKRIWISNMGLQWNLGAQIQICNCENS